MAGWAVAFLVAQGSRLGGYAEPTTPAGGPDPRRTAGRGRPGPAPDRPQPVAARARISRLAAAGLTNSRLARHLGSMSIPRACGVAGGMTARMACGGIRATSPRSTGQLSTDVVPSSRRTTCWSWIGECDRW